MSNKTSRAITAAWSVGDNKSFVISCASSKEGEYLVGITLQTDREGNEALVIMHDCPAARNGYDCWHLQAAIACYRGWIWWRNLPAKILKVNRPIKLQPNWIQIPLRPKIQQTAEV